VGEAGAQCVSLAFEQDLKRRLQFLPEAHINLSTDMAVHVSDVCTIHVVIRMY
jgi:hypothetical protein